MKIFALAVTAAAMLATPALAQDVKVRIGTPGVVVGTPGVVVTDGYRRHRHREACRTVVVKERVGNTTVVKKRSSC